MATPSDRDLLLQIASDIATLRENTKTRLTAVESALNDIGPRLLRVERRTAYFSGALLVAGSVAGYGVGMLF